MYDSKTKKKHRTRISKTNKLINQITMNSSNIDSYKIIK